MAKKRQSKQDQGEGLSIVRVLNKQSILEIILQFGAISRPKISQESRLSLPTVMAIVESLESIGLIHTQGANSGSVGRPASLYSINPLAGYIFAVDLGGTKTLAGITDLCGDVLAKKTEATEKDTAEATVSQLDRLHKELLAESGIDPKTAGAACIGIPGVWDAETDQIDAAFNLPLLSEIRLHEAIQNSLGIPVSIENDVNLAAMGEAWAGEAQDHDTFVAVSVGTGIGMGIVINGEIYRGRNGAAGEVGLLPIGTDPFDPNLHPQGAFESVASGLGIRRQLIEEIEQGRDTRLNADATVQQIAAAAQAGDSLAQEILDREARTLAIGLAAIVAILDPSLIILGGGVGVNVELTDQITQYTQQLIQWMPPIAVSSLGNEAAFHGAIAHGMPIAREQILLGT